MVRTSKSDNFQGLGALTSAVLSKTRSRRRCLGENGSYQVNVRVLKGKLWGKSVVIDTFFRGIISYQLSPHEQAVSSVVFPKFGNTVKRIAQQTPWVLPRRWISFSCFYSFPCFQRLLSATESTFGLKRRIWNLHERIVLNFPMSNSRFSTWFEMNCWYELWMVVTGRRRGMEKVHYFVSSISWWMWKLRKSRNVCESSAVDTRLKGIWDSAAAYGCSGARKAMGFTNSRFFNNF